MKSVLALFYLSAFSMLNHVSAQTRDRRNFNNAHVLQDLETYGPAGPRQTNSYQVPINPAAPGVNYNTNPYFPRPAPPARPAAYVPVAQGSTLQYQPVTQAPVPAITPQYQPVTRAPVPAITPQYQPVTRAPVPAIAPQVVPPVVQTAANNPSYYPQTPASSVAGYGPHIYSAQGSQNSGPAQTWNDLQNRPVIILVKNPNSLSYDMAYAPTGLGNLDRDTNSQLIAKMLLRNNDKVGVIYPSNGFPINQFPDFPIGNLILPQDMGLEKMFTFYPRYVPILYLFSNEGYKKVNREIRLSHLGQYKYD